MQLINRVLSSKMTSSQTVTNIFKLTKPVLIFSQISGLIFYRIRFDNKSVFVSKSRVLFFWACFVYTVDVSTKIRSFEGMLKNHTHNHENGLSFLTFAYVTLRILVIYLPNLVGDAIFLSNARSVCHIVLDIHRLFSFVSSAGDFRFRYFLRFHVPWTYFFFSFSLISSVISFFLGERRRDYPDWILYFLSKTVGLAFFVQFTVIVSLLHVFFTSINEMAYRCLKDRDTLRMFMRIDDLAKDAVQKINTIYAVVIYVRVFCTFFKLIYIVPKLVHLLDNYKLGVYYFLSTFHEILCLLWIISLSTLMRSEVGADDFVLKF